MALTLNDRWLYAFDGARMRVPEGMGVVALPGQEFIQYHNDCVFERF